VIEPDTFAEVNDVIGSVRQAVTSLDRALAVVIQRRFGVFQGETAEAPEGDCRGMRRGMSRLEREALAQLRIILGPGPGALELGRGYARQTIRGRGAARLLLSE
jgi:hypothetical protein